MQYYLKLELYKVNIEYIKRSKIQICSTYTKYAALTDNKTWPTFGSRPASGMVIALSLVLLTNLH